MEVCFASDTSKNVLVGASNLESGRIIRFPIQRFDSRTQKMANRYSIEVRQYSINEESFRFWESIRSSSEEQGSLFDQQPGNVLGNIRSVADENEKVLGNFDVSQVTVSRLFFNPGDFAQQGYRVFSNTIVDCDSIAPKTTPQSGILVFMEQFALDYDIWFIGSGFAGPPDVNYKIKECTDCRLYGTTVKPDFWID